MTFLRSAARVLLPVCLGLVVVHEGDAQWTFGPVGSIDLWAYPNITAAIGYARPVTEHSGSRLGDWGFSLGAGIGLDDTRRIIPQIGFWWEAFFAIGCKAAVYTHSDQTALVVVPEIGFGLVGFRLVWGFPWRLAGPEMSGINRSQFSIYYYHPLSKEGW